ncbi:MAG: SCO1664 family protein [Ardenticatenaceae bacterium]|nr:SCO1664 family protein [Ardenticatenaceae bacterium]MCB8986337.1 SCO1664 family protein [Ardenticatenaceae bacterium]
MASADDSAEILNLLQTGILEVEGLLPWSSNYTFLVQICSQAAAGDKTKIEAVYKPRRGERPLWDFSQGTLCQRERAAFLTSQALGWNLVPPTVLREGPHGLGSVQLFITHDPDSHYLTFEGEPAYRAQLQKIVLFDIIVNNADRKSGHVLLEESGNSDGSNRLWTIDHGICFHVEPKLRTVIWEFAGEPIPDDLLQTLRDFEEQLSTNGEGLLTGLASLLTRSEIAAMQKRAQRLVQNGRFNQPGSGRHYPWPPI